MILPASALAFRQFPGFFRQLRASLLETLAQDYILTARAKGLPEQTIFLKHAFRNAINPLITMLGNSIGSLLSGAFIVEAIMSWPGLGDLRACQNFCVHKFSDTIREIAQAANRQGGCLQKG